MDSYKDFAEYRVMDVHGIEKTAVQAVEMVAMQRDRLIEALRDAGLHIDQDTTYADVQRQLVRTADCPNTATRGSTGMMYGCMHERGKGHQGDCLFPAALVSALQLDLARTEEARHLIARDRQQHAEQLGSIEHLLRVHFSKEPHPGGTAADITLLLHQFITLKDLWGEVARLLEKQGAPLTPGAAPQRVMDALTNVLEGAAVLREVVEPVKVGTLAISEALEKVRLFPEPREPGLKRQAVIDLTRYDNGETWLWVKFHNGRTAGIALSELGGPVGMNFRNWADERFGDQDLRVPACRAPHLDNERCQHPGGFQHPGPHLYTREAVERKAHRLAPGIDHQQAAVIDGLATLALMVLAEQCRLQRRRRMCQLEPTSPKIHEKVILRGRNVTICSTGQDYKTVTRDDKPTRRVEAIDEESGAKVSWFVDQDGRVINVEDLRQAPW